jgi:hypothetical protein
MLGVITYDENGRRVLEEALELHAKGLEEAHAAVTTDGTICDPQDLADVTGDLSRDYDIANELLGRLHDC